MDSYFFLLHIFCVFCYVKAQLNKMFTLASFKFPSLKCKAPTLFKISGGTSASTFSFKILDAAPYADSAAYQEKN